MKKADMIKEILENVENIGCAVVKVYGVAFGVGYDLNVVIELKSGKFEVLKAHAVSKSWACIGHLRANQSQFKVYTGSNDCYRDAVCKYWESKKGLQEYLERLTKSELTDWSA